MFGFMLPDISRVTAAIREAAAAEILPRFQNLARHEIGEKGPGDLVTIADLETERHLGRLLTAIAPGTAVIGEEAVHKDKALLGLLEGPDPVWVIDPVDGTLNFAEARPVFAVILALVRDGRTLAGWIHDPLRDATITASEGAGAWLDGRRLRVVQGLPLNRLTGALYGRFGERGSAKRIGAASGRLGRIRNLGCVGREYMELAEGLAHFALYSRTWPWDHAAGVLIQGEAGGYSAFLDGQPYSPLRREGQLLLAPDPDAWHDLSDLLLTTPTLPQPTQP